MVVEVVLMLEKVTVPIKVVVKEMVSVRVTLVEADSVDRRKMVVVVTVLVVKTVWLVWTPTYSVTRSVKVRLSVWVIKVVVVTVRVVTEVSVWERMSLEVSVVVKALVVVDWMTRRTVREDVSVKEIVSVERMVRVRKVVWGDWGQHPWHEHAPWPCTRMASARIAPRRSKRKPAIRFIAKKAPTR